MAGSVMALAPGTPWRSGLLGYASVRPFSFSDSAASRLSITVKCLGIEPPCWTVRAVDGMFDCYGDSIMCGLWRNSPDRLNWTWFTVIVGHV